MSKLLDSQVKIELTSEQQQTILDATGRRIPSVELGSLHLAVLVLTATAAGSQTLAISDSAETRKQMLRQGSDASQNSDLFLISIDMTEEQREQIRKLTGKTMTSLTIAPDERPVTYHENWAADAGQLRIGRSIVITKAGSETAPPNPTDHVIILASEGSSTGVFGTGAHPATQLSLVLLEEYIKPDDHVLDVGTGSGILAVAAARLGASEVMAIDIEPAAVLAAQATVTANNLTETIRVEQGSIEATLNSNYDVVVANVFPNVIISLASQLAQVTRDSGVLVVSGIVTARSQDVIHALSKEGFVVETQRSLHGWDGMALRRR